MQAAFIFYATLIVPIRDKSSSIYQNKDILVLEVVCDVLFTRTVIPLASLELDTKLTSLVWVVVARYCELILVET